MRLISDEALAVVTIYQEAAGEAYIGKLAVAEVIRNRIKQRYQSDGSVAGTVLRAYQFSGWNANDPGRIRAVKADGADAVVQDCLKAWHEAWAGSNTIGDAVLYYNPTVVAVPKWARAEYAIQVAEVGRHVFFIPKPTVEV